MNMNGALYITSGDILIRKDDREEFDVISRYKDKGDPNEKLEVENIHGDHITLSIDDNLFKDWEKKEVSNEPTK